MVSRQLNIVCVTNCLRARQYAPKACHEYCKIFALIFAVMGNHEFNAIAYYTADHEGRGFSDRIPRRIQDKHQAFLDAYQGSPAAYEDTIHWFKTLLLWLDLADLRVIHACWDKNEIDQILKYQDGDHYLSEELFRMSCRSGTWQFKAVETILKGKEIPLKPGASFKDKDGNVRHHIRVRWWDRNATSYKDAFMGSESARTHIPDDKIEVDHMMEYSHESPPVFFEHYWMEGEPVPLAPNIACLDYGVAKPGGEQAGGISLGWGENIRPPKVPVCRAH